MSRAAQDADQQMGQVRPATADDLAAIARVHQAAFDAFFMSLLGRCYLRGYYGLILEFRRGILHVAEEDGKIVGLVGGYLGGHWFEGIMREHWVGLALRTLPGLLRRPSLIKSLLKIFFSNLFHPKTPTKEELEAERTVADLAWLAVDPDYRRKGYGRDLVAAFAESAWELGAEKVLLTTASEANETANQFYRKLGFVVDKQYKGAGDRLMNWYAIYLDDEQAPVFEASEEEEQEAAGDDQPDHDDPFAIQPLS